MKPPSRWLSGQTEIKAHGTNLNTQYYFQMKIFLIGFMGSGKTTMGRKLAQWLGYEFIDLDKLIEAQSGMSITEYFHQNGEEAFRALERNILQETIYPDKAIISTGGGAPCYFDNMEWMNNNGTVVYLSLPPKVLASRLENAKSERPSLKNLKGEELENLIVQMLEKREPFYKQAKFIINNMDLSPQNVAGHIGISNS